MPQLRYLATAAALAIVVAQSPWPQALTEAEGMVATSAEDMRSQAGTSALGAPSWVGISIPALIGNSVDSGAAPYSASAAYSLATTSDSVSVSDTQATTLPGIARSTLTATTCRGLLLSVSWHGVLMRSHYQTAVP